MTEPIAVDVAAELAKLTFLPNRTPETPDDATGWAAEVAKYRDGGMYIAHYAGNSEWERHGQGDEIVLVLEGATTLTVLRDGVETPYSLEAHQFLIVPQGLWHRFETPDAVKILSVTPQPTDHSIARPE